MQRVQYHDRTFSSNGVGIPNSYSKSKVQWTTIGLQTSKIAFCEPLILPTKNEIELTE